MDDKDKLINELHQKVCSLESRVEYLQGILKEAKLPYENEIEQPEETVMSIDATEENQGARII